MTFPKMSVRVFDWRHKNLVNRNLFPNTHCPPHYNSHSFTTPHPPSSMPPSPKLDSLSFPDDPTSTSTTLSLLTPRRRTRRLPTLLLALPLTCILLYFLLLPPTTSWLDHSHLFIPSPAYVSHSGKSALRTTIGLPPVQFAFGTGEGGDEERLGVVREAIFRTWWFYVKDAWGWDEVRPVQGGGRDTRFRSCFV